MKYNVATAVGIVAAVNYCTIEIETPAGAGYGVGIVGAGGSTGVGADAEAFNMIGWHIVAPATLTGTIDLQIKDFDGIYTTIIAANTVLSTMTAVFPFQISVTTTAVNSFGTIGAFICWGARFLVTVTAGTITKLYLAAQVAELG